MWYLRRVVLLLGVGCGGSHVNNPPDNPPDASGDGPVDAPMDGPVEPVACPPMMAPRIAAAGSPSGVAVADINADGKPDLVITLDGTIVGGVPTVPAALDVMLGNGAGSFQPAVRTVIDSAALAKPMAPVVVDIDGDGDLDVVIALSGFDTSAVQVVLGDGRGGFTLGNRLAGARPTSVAVADLDRDGKIDIVTTSAFVASGVSILFGSGNGNFGVPLVLDGATLYDSVTIGDLDGDHLLDVVAAGDELGVFRGGGTGTFDAPLKTPMSADYGHQVAIGDLNGDGIPDIATSGWFASDEHVYVETWLGSGTGAFVKQSLLVRLPDRRSDLPPPNQFRGRFPAVLVLADLDADTKLDVAVSFQDRDVIGFIKGTGTGDLRSFTEYATGRAPSALATADINNDGRPDLIAVSDSHVEVVLGTPIGTLRAPRGLPSFLNNEGFPFKVAIGDVDGDGQVDFVDGVVNYDDRFPFIGTILIVRSSGPTRKVFPPVNPHVEQARDDDIVLRDVDGDGDLDMIMSTNRLTAGYVSVFFNAGDGTFGTQVNYTTGVALDLAVGDLNGDQRPEIVIAAGDPFGGGGITTTVLENDRAGGFTARAAFPSQVHILLHDFNGDGRLDLATSGDTPSVSVRLGNGDGTFRSPIDTTTTAVISHLLVANINGDGVPDLGGGTATETLALTGNGDGTFTSAATLPAAPGGLIALADLDHTAPLDIVGSAGVVYRAGSEVRTDDWPIVASELTDATKDGHPDVIGISPRANTVFVLSSQCP